MLVIKPAITVTYDSVQYDNDNDILYNFVTLIDDPDKDYNQDNDSF